MSDWIVLTTKPRFTMTLAETLREDGLEVWTPIESYVFRVPRMNAKRTIRRAGAPGYIFARVIHKDELETLAAMPVKPRRIVAGENKPAHAPFRLFRDDGKIITIADCALDEMRTWEAKRTPKRVADYAFPRNERVRVKEGPGSGKRGMVIRSTPAKTKILCIGDLYAFEIPTSHLEPDAIQSDQEPLLRAA